MNQFEIINEKLKEINKELIDYAKTLEFEQICEFDLKNCNSIPWNKLDYKGIYLIEIKRDSNFVDFNTWIESFKNEWEDKQYKDQFVPNLKKMRINKHKNKDLAEWIPLYIGKSKKISGRIHEHIFKEMGKRTFALKLNGREHAKKERFKLSIIKITTDNYDWIVPVLENTLRNKINPIIGKQ